jgi:hypothetical protein
MSAPVPATLGRIFISYRHEETPFAAGRLFDRLVAHFGEGQIFMDIDTIQPGDDFAEVITSAVASCNVLLVLIGDRWLTITGDDGQRRLDHPEDFVRLEIQAALTQKIRVIPVLVGGARMPRAAELPDGLAKLAHRQAVELSPARFDSDIGRLLRVLDRALSDATAQRASAAGDVVPAPMPSDLVVPSALPSGLRGWLELPKDGDEVGGRIEVRGHVTGWRHDYKLWIVHRKEPQGALWPKAPEIRPDDRGNFSVSVMEGGPRGRVIISLLAVRVSRSRDFEKWLQDSEVTGHYPGIYPTSADGELASVTVSHTPDV